MKVKELEVLAANLYKEAEEAIPLLGDGDKKEWMAHRLDAILEGKSPLLNCLLSYDTISEAMDLLEKEYLERKEDKTDQVLPPCPSVESKKQEHKVHSTHKKETVHSQVTVKASRAHAPTGIIEEDLIIVKKVQPNRKNTNVSPSDDNFIC